MKLGNINLCILGLITKISEETCQIQATQKIPFTNKMQKTHRVSRNMNEGQENLGNSHGFIIPLAYILCSY